MINKQQRDDWCYGIALLIIVATVLANLSCTPPSDQLARIQREAVAEEPAPPRLEVSGSCISEVGEMLWGTPPSIYLRPYCSSPDQPWLAGDFDFNGVWNEQDVAWFAFCAAGSGIPPPTERNGAAVACWLCDLDHDGDVDQSDFGLLQADLGRRWTLLPGCGETFGRGCVQP